LLICAISRPPNMKNYLLVALLLISVNITLASKPAKTELPSGYFMILAAYASTAENYAVKFVQDLKEKGIQANYGFSNTKNLFFVYSANYSSKSEAVKAINTERERTGEEKAWVYVYKADNDNVAIKENTSEPIEKTTIAKEEEMTEKEPTVEEEVVVVEEEVTEVPVSHQGLTYLYIEAFDATDGNPITIDFEVIDLTRKKEIARTHSNYSFPLKEPNSASKMIQVQSNDIAWQPQSFDFKYYEPVIDPMSIFLDNLGDTTFVKFEMKPLKKGEIITLYKVFFYKDASIMMGKSEYELDQVVALLKSNPNHKIVIHGHTNGNSAGKIIALKEHDDVDFFNINGDHRELAGSATKLSAERASIVGKYLASKGIDESRFEIKGWGGKKMIYDKHSPDARYNVRVEIEVVEE
jgi:outer membrane protein OmpA-like peptidoglycan-associated protein